MRWACIASSDSKKLLPTVGPRLPEGCTWSWNCDAHPLARDQLDPGIHRRRDPGNSGAEPVAVSFINTRGSGFLLLACVILGIYLLREGGIMIKKSCFLWVVVLVATSVFSADGKTVSYKSGDETVQGVL